MMNIAAKIGIIHDSTKGKGEKCGWTGKDCFKMSLNCVNIDSNMTFSYRIFGGIARKLYLCSTKILNVWQHLSDLFLS